MSYIGIQPAESFTSFATQTFSVSATTSYTLDHAVANENEIALFVNNVRQQPGSGKAYTATGTALTLSAATATTDTMYCIFLGRALQTVVPATNSITNAMITDSTITSAKLTGVTQGITVADSWRITSDGSASSSEADITANWERVDTTGQGTVGSAMSVSSGVFTFPSTGIYLVTGSMSFYKTGDARYVNLLMKLTTDNSSYATIAEAYDSISGVQGTSTYANPIVYTLLDVTDTSNVKIKFAIRSTADTSYKGNTDQSNNSFTFLRLGDT